jgi:cbb3-type cytochrome oxidase maturation protein
MSVLFLVVPLALVVVGTAVAAWVWSARSGQFDDLDTPAVRMLHDDTGEPSEAAWESGQSRPRSLS